MVKLIKPQEASVQQLSGISPSAGAGAARAGASIGQAQQQLGGQIAAVGQQMLDQATQAFKTAQYSNALSSATTQFNEQFQARLQQPTDAEGNPGFQTLVQDTDVLGNQVLQEISQNIADPQVRMQFATDFQRHISNRQIMALSQARQQQTDFARASMTESISNLTQQAVLDDPALTGDYQSNINQIIDSNRAAGLITEQQAGQLKANANGDIVQAQVSNLIKADPKGAIDRIRAGEFNQPGVDPQRLLRMAESGLADQARQQTAQQAEKLRQQKELLNLAAQEIEIGLVDGSMGMAEIDKSFHITPEDLQTPLGRAKARKRLQLIKKLKTTSAKGAVNSRISDRIGREQTLHEFTPGQIDTHYQQSLRNAGDNVPLLGDNNGPSKVGIAADYGTNIPSLQRELQMKVLDGSDQDASEALQAIQVLRVKNPAIIRNLGSDAHAVAVAAEARVKAGARPGDAIRLAREAIQTVDPAVRTLRQNQFKKLKAFSSGKIKSTIQADAQLGFFKDLGRKLPTQGVVVSDEVVATVGNLYRENYIITGDEEQARQMTSDQISGVYGISEFGEKPGFFNDKERLMKLPPEFVTDDVDFLKEDLADTVRLDLPENVSVDDVIVESDFMTTTDRPTYGLYYRDSAGAKRMLTDSQGSPIRWLVQPNLHQQQKDREFETAKARGAARAEQERLEGRTEIEAMAEEEVRQFLGLDKEIPSEVLKELQNGADSNDLGDEEKSGTSAPTENPVSSKPQAGLINKINTNLAAYTSNKIGTRYGFGSKSTQKGKIDCSGWVHEAVLRMSGNLPGVDTVGLGKMLNTYAAQQIKNIEQATGPAMNNINGAKPGMLVGITRPKVPSWARGRYKGISHIGVVVEKDGQLMVSHSGGSTKGVGFVPLETFVASSQQVHVVDPFKRAR